MKQALANFSAPEPILTLSFVPTDAQPNPEVGNSSVVNPHLDESWGTDTRVETALLEGGHPQVTQHCVTGDGFVMEHLAVDGELVICGHGPSKVVIVWVVAGRVETHFRGTSAAAGTGDVMVGSVGTTPFRVRVRDAELRTVALDRSLIERVAADTALPDGVARPSPYLASLVPHSVGAAHLWTRTHDYVAETMGADDVASPLVVANLGRLLALTVLAVFGAQGTKPAVAQRSNGEGSVAHPVMLRKAMAYIEAHARYDVGVNDVAAAVYLTPRALQYMFRKHLDVTPMAYLRRIRLQHVHAELVRSNRRTTTVATAAARWGFGHTGRFAVLYRETYGRSPHITLRE